MAIDLKNKMAGNIGLLAITTGNTGCI